MTLSEAIADVQRQMASPAWTIIVKRDDFKKYRLAMEKAIDRERWYLDTTWIRDSDMTVIARLRLEAIEDDRLVRQIMES